MKHIIIKEGEPQEFIDWKKKDKMYVKGKPNWDRLPSSIKNILREKISREQGFICCYCERRITSNDFHLEHLKPKDGSKYPLLQLDYDNLLCSCQLELEKGEPRHCGNGKGSWYDEAKFVSPLQADCENRFKYTYDGQIFPSDSNDDAAITTIARLRLDIDKLNKFRENAIEPFLNLDSSLSQDELNSFVHGYLAEKSEFGGKFNEFYTTIKYLFGN